MKYLFTTLAIGQKYYDTAMDFSNKLMDLDPDALRIVVSDIDTDHPANTIIIKIEENTQFTICNTFNYNLKYLAIKEALNFDSECIIFTDADWIISKGYENNKIVKFLDDSDPQIDFFFERPHGIGDSKRNLNNCFWRHKIEPYGLMHTDKYDKAHVCNEQFMVFKNNSRLKDFVSFWSSRNQFCIDKNVWTFAEGVEIGMSAIDAGLSSQYTFFSQMNNCFEFYDQSGNLHTRF